MRVLGPLMLLRSTVAAACVVSLLAACPSAHALPTPVSANGILVVVNQQDESRDSSTRRTRRVTHSLRQAPGLERFDVDTPWGQYVDQKGTVAPTIFEDSERAVTVSPWVPGRESLGVQMEVAW